MLPLCEELDSHLTPAEFFPAFLDEPYPLFLDSGMSPAFLGRYSYIMAAPLGVLRSKKDCFDGKLGETTWTGHGDPFRELQRLSQSRKLPLQPHRPPFQGGWAGYFGYELGRHVESLPGNVEDDLDIPDMYVCLYDWVIAHDHQTGQTWLFADGGPAGSVQQAYERLHWVRAKLADYHRQRISPPNHVLDDHRRARFPKTRPSTAAVAVVEPATDPFTANATQATRSAVANDVRLHPNFTHQAYLEALEEVNAYITAGDIYQTNLSQRFDVPLPGDPWSLYTTLRGINPAPFAAYLQFPELTVLSASPELFLKVDEGKVVTRPIKGTRPRGKTPAADQALARELLESEKDRAENLMIVDLLRNDLGRVCEIGSVAVPELFVLEEYPTVWHLVSTVIGRLPASVDAVDLLRACFPGGSITGAPKIRAMEIIDELEPTERGVYCGSIGYLGNNGSMNTSIVIRTMVVRNERVYFQVGGGIVADSDPEEEYQETLDKARALIMTLEKAWSKSLQ